MWKNVFSFVLMDFKACSWLASPTCFDSGLLETSTKSTRRVLFRKKIWLKSKHNKASLMQFKIN